MNYARDSRLTGERMALGHLLDVVTSKIFFHGKTRATWYTKKPLLIQSVLPLYGASDSAGRKGFRYSRSTLLRNHFKNSLG